MNSSQARTYSVAALGWILCAFCAVLPLTIAGANIGWGVISAAVVAFALAGGSLDWSRVWSPPALWLWLYFSVCVLTAGLGIDPSHSFRFINQDFHKIWLFSLFSIALAINPEPRAVYAMALAFAAAAVIGLGQEVWYFRHGFSTWMRAHAFVHPVVYGEQMAAAIIGVICVLIHPGSLLPRPWHRRLAVALLILLSAALAVNNTRAAIVALLLGIAAVFLIQPRLRRWTPWLLGASVMLLAAAIYVSGHVLQRERPLRQELARVAAGGDVPTQGALMRLVLWKVALEMARDHPWTGVGLNNYRTEFRRYFNGTLEGGARDWGTAHNLILHHFAERGIIGVAAIVALFWSFWSRALRRARDHPNAFTLWAFGSWTAFAVMNMTEVAFQNEIVWMLMFFIWCWAEETH